MYKSIVDRGNCYSDILNCQRKLGEREVPKTYDFQIEMKSNHVLLNIYKINLSELLIYNFIYEKYYFYY